jgi:hypothetical protein
VLLFALFDKLDWFLDVARINGVRLCHAVGTSSVSLRAGRWASSRAFVLPGAHSQRCSLDGAAGLILATLLKQRINRSSMTLLLFSIPGYNVACSD